MKNKFVGLIVGSFLFSQVAIGQNSPGSSEPGMPPPPEGWTKESPEDGGIHLPRKTKKGHIKLKSRPGELKAPKEEASPTAESKIE